MARKDGQAPRSNKTCQKYAPDAPARVLTARFPATLRNPNLPMVAASVYVLGNSRGDMWPHAGLPTVFWIIGTGALAIRPGWTVAATSARFPRRRQKPSRPRLFKALSKEGADRPVRRPKSGGGATGARANPPVYAFRFRADVFARAARAWRFPYFMPSSFRPSGSRKNTA
jgi:hypothetical protein